MMPPFTGLRVRLVGAVFLVLAGLLAVTAVVVVLRAERGLREAEEKRFRAVTLQLAQSVRYATLAQSAELLRPVLETFARTPDLVAVNIFGEGDRLIATWPGGSAPPVGVTIRVPVHTGGELNEELAAFGLNDTARRVVGFAVAEFSSATTDAIEQQMRRDMVTAFLLVGGLGLLGILLLASSVVGRLRRLMAAATQVAAGDLTVTVVDAGTDELASLSRAFNVMTQALGAQRRLLDDAGRQLAEREALAAIGRATAVIAHEIRNPLGILLGASQIVGEPKRPEADRVKAAAMIESEVRRLERTLGSLLDYARPKRSSRTRVELTALCRTTAERATFVGGPAVGLEVRVEGDASWALVDEQQASQIVLNLLVNAAQAGATLVSIQVRTDRQVSVQVSDNGPGVAQSISAQIFHPFVTTKQHGAGLGLAGSRRMARDNGGDLVLLATRPGAHFELALVRAPEDEAS